MDLTLKEIKSLISFCKKNSVTKFALGVLKVEFEGTITPQAMPVEEENYFEAEGGHKRPNFAVSELVAEDADTMNVDIDSDDLYSC